jgi:hypothetical protein
MSILDDIDKRKFPVGGAWTDKERFFRVERAASGRSTCKACKQKIDAGELRIELVWSAYFDHGSPNQGFMHPQCLRSAQARFGTRDGFWKNYGVLYGNITVPALQLRDYDHLSDEHRRIINDIFTGDPKTTRPTAAAAAAAAARLAAVTPVSAAIARAVAAVSAPPDQKKKAAPAAKRKAASTKRASKYDDSEEDDDEDASASEEDEEEEEFEPRAKRAKKATALEATGAATSSAVASKKPTAASRKKAAAASAAEDA